MKSEKQKTQGSDATSTERLSSKLKSIPLTDEQSKLVEENIGLCYWAIGYLNQYSDETLADDEFESEVLYTFIRCCRSWDPKGLSKLSHYFRTSISRERHRFLAKRFKRNERYSLVDWNTNSLDIVQQETENRFSDEVIQFINSEIKTMEKRSAIALKTIFFEGKRFEDLGNILGVSKQRAQQIKLRAQEQLRIRILEKFGSMEK